MAMFKTDQYRKKPLEVGLGLYRDGFTLVDLSRRQEMEKTDSINYPGQKYNGKKEQRNYRKTLSHPNKRTAILSISFLDIRNGTEAIPY